MSARPRVPSVSRVPTVPWGGVVAALAWPAAGAAALAFRDPALVRSGAGAMQEVLAAALLAWPITAGVAAAAVVRVWRPRTRDLVLALPDRARLRVVIGQAGAVGAWSLGGLLLSVVGAAVIAAAHSSVASPVAYARLVPVMVGTLGVAAFGGCIGGVVRSWFAPPLVATGLYLLYVFAPDSGAGILRFAVGDGRSAVTLVPEVAAVGALTLALAICAGGFLVVTAGWTTVRPRAVVVGVGSLFLAGVLLGQAAARPAFVVAGSDTWSCATTTSGAGRVCVPDEQRRDLPQLADELDPIAGRIGSVWSPEGGVVLGPVAGDGVTLPVPVPFGEFETIRGRAAESLSSFVVDCGLRGDLGNPDVYFDTYFGFIGWLTSQTYASPGQEPVPPLDDAAAAALLQTVPSCVADEVA